MEIRTDLWNGELVTAKAGGDPATLRREAALLKELDHPGLVAFAKLEEGESGPRLLTRYAGRHSLNTWQPRRVEDLLSVFEGLAAALSYLHGKNLFHLNLCSDHVLIGMSQSPILCSFAAAKQTETPGESSDLAAQDIADLGLTMLKAIEGAPPSLKRKGKRLTERLRLLAVAAAEGRIRSAPNLQGQLRGLTSVLASRQRCTSGQISPRDVESPRGESLENNKFPVHATRSDTLSPDPNAAKSLLQLESNLPELNENLPSFVDAAPPGSIGGKVIEDLEEHPSSFAMPRTFKVRTTGGLDKERLKPRRRLSARRLLRLVCIFAGFLTLALLTVMLLREEEAEDDLAQVSEPVELENSPKSAPALEGQTSKPDKQTQPQQHTENRLNETQEGDSAPQHLQIEGDSSYCPPESPGYLIVDRSGCAKRVVVGVGFVSVGGRSYPVGGPSDKLFVGDWNCDGVSTIALAEPSGKVYVFDDWPTSEALEPVWADNLPRNGSVEMVSEGNCDLLMALDEEGNHAQLKPRLPPT